MGVRVTQTKVEHEGMKFDSKEELGFYLYLKEQDDVSCIHRQTGFVLVEKQEQYVVKHLKTKDKIVKKLLEFPVIYHADFVYRKCDTIIVCDVKSKYTHSFREFVIVRKLMVRKIIEHNKRRHGGEPKVVFLEAVTRALSKKQGGGFEFKFIYKPIIE